MRCIRYCASLIFILTPFLLQTAHVQKKKKRDGAMTMVPSLSHYRAIFIAL